MSDEQTPNPAPIADADLAQTMHDRGDVAQSNGRYGEASLYYAAARGLRERDERIAALEADLERIRASKTKADVERVARAIADAESDGDLGFRYDEVDVARRSYLRGMACAAIHELGHTIEGDAR